MTPVMPMAQSGRRVLGSTCESDSAGHFVETRCAPLRRDKAARKEGSTLDT